MESQDPEDRIAELERQLGEAKAAAWRSASARGAAAPPLNSFGYDAYSPSSQDGAALASAPRRVPIRFLLAEILPFRWWYLFAMFIVAIPPIILWIMEPAFVLPAAVVVLLAIYVIHARGALARIALLKWGQPATVIESEVLSQGTYYGGTTYSNVVLPVARGWTVTRPLWSGPKTKTRIRYRLDDYQGAITVGGREYIDGVVLADQRKPERALCVTSFPYDLDRDDSGNWTGGLRARLQIGMICWLLIMVGWVGGAAFVFEQASVENITSHSASAHGSTGPGSTPISPMTPGPGQAVVVNGAGETRSIVCDMNDVTVNGSDNRVDISGHCSSVSVTGMKNRVSLDVADSITANGMDNVVTFRAGAPHINTGGMSNVVKPG
jgi:hypothetical protein